MRTVALLVTAWAFAVMAIDISRREIWNSLVLCAMMAGFSMLLITGRSMLGVSLGDVLIGMAIALLLTLPAYFAGWLGAGDAKLLAAIGVLGGWQYVVSSFVIGAVLALVPILLWALFRQRCKASVKQRWIPYGAVFSAGLLVAIGTGAA